MLVLAPPQEGFEGVKQDVVLVRVLLQGAQLDPNPKSDLVVLVIAPENGSQQHPNPQNAIAGVSNNLPGPPELRRPGGLPDV